VDYLVKPLIPVILRAKVTGFVELFLKTEQVRRQAEQLRQMERREFEHRLAEENVRLREQQKALAESEQRFRQLAENINEVFWMFDAQQSKILYVSPAYETIWGRPCQSLYEERLSFLDTIQPNDRDLVQAAMAKHRQGEAAAAEYRIVRPDGSIRWIRDRGFPITDEAGLVYRVAGVAEDITEQRESARALRASEQRLHAIIDNSPAIIFLKDTAGCYLLVNRAFERYAGLDRKQIEGRSDHEIFPQQVADIFAAGDQRVLQERTVLQSEEVIPLDDRALTVIAIKFPLLDAAGVPHAICGIATDITDRKQAEEALREADRRKNEFLAMLAHELRNPMAPIRNAVQIMRLLGPTDAKLESAREMIERQVEHMTRLVDDLLEVSRITTGKIKLQKEPVDLVEVVQRGVETSRPLIEARHHEFTVSYPPEPIRLQADPTRLAQVISNLLNNAAKYTESGGHIWLTVSRVEAEAVVRVRDSGIGISADLLQRIFDLFTQADRSLDRSQGGLGIGLTLVKSLVEMHGGSITADSKGPGKGSEFVMRLPVAAVPEHARMAESQAPTAASAPATVNHQRSCRVLVVDDIKDAAESVALLLRLWGHEVRTVADGAAALEAVRGFRPQVVLLDIGLPNMDGYEVARQLREEFGPQEMVLIAVTGYGQSEDRRKSAQVGFNHHLVKPVNPNELQALLACATLAER
jgi:PAS domain S-box-containing protein